MVQIQELRIGLAALEKLFGLPENMKIASIREIDNNSIVIKIASDAFPVIQEDFYLQTQDLSKIGEMFQQPEKYLVSNKGQIRENNG